MNAWKDEYQKKIVSADEAVRHIESGKRVAISHAGAVPQLSIDALIRNKDHFKDVEIYSMLCMGPGEYTSPEMAGHFKHITNFVAGNSRKAINEGRADFIPLHFSEVPRMIKRGILPIDVAIVQLSVPDENGNCSFGISCDYTSTSAKYAKLVIGEVNKQMPFVYGDDNMINVSDIDYVIEADYPLYELPSSEIGEVEKKIGEYCASLVNDGDTLQLGIGAIPDAILIALEDKKDLGIHTEMLSNGVVKLVKKGVINGSKKTLHPNKIIATFIMGDRSLYDFVDHNKEVELYPSDYTNAPEVIMKNDNMVSINSCVEIDLTGQVASESIGEMQISGTGGQVDFIRGASMAKNGRSILAMPSTAKKGTSSKIVANLTSGTAVTTLRNDVDYIVTEYGIASLKCKTLRERAEALIAIAHPDFREELIKEYKRRFHI